MQNKHFKVHEGKNGKFFVSDNFGDGELMLPLTRKDLAKKVAYDLNKQLQSYKNELTNENDNGA